MNDQLALRPQSFVALSANEVAPAQAQLATWCKAKILALSQDLKEQIGNLRQARAMHWRRTGWQAAARKTKGQMIYYAKIKAAVEAGYLVVPNFDVEVIAVRTRKGVPAMERDRTVATPEVLPPGQGRYVSNALVGYTEDRTYKDYNGTNKTVQDFIPTDFSTEIDFPIKLVQPVILAATSRAMALKLFDRIGVVKGGKKSDPIVVGQILNPKHGNRDGAYRNNPTCVSFFVAWWLDTNDL